MEFLYLFLFGMLVPPAITPGRVSLGSSSSS